MPVKGSFDQNIKINTNIDVAIEGNWKDYGQLTNVVTNSTNNGMILAKEGMDINYSESEPEDYTTYYEQVNLAYTFKNGLNSLGLTKDGGGVYYPTGHRTIKIDLSPIKIYAGINMIVDLYDFGEAPNNNMYYLFEVSYDNGSTWQTLSWDRVGIITNTGRHIGSLPGLTVGQDVSNMKILIRETLNYSQDPITHNGAGTLIYDTNITLTSAYKTTGTWISNPIPLSDVEFPDIINDYIGTYYQNVYNITTSVICQASYDNGVTWYTFPSNSIIHVLASHTLSNGINFKIGNMLIVKFTFTTTNIAYSPRVDNVYFTFNSKLPINSLQLKESTKIKVKELNFVVNALQGDATHTLLTDDFVTTRNVLLMQNNDAYTRAINFIIISRPRTIKIGNQEQISVRCYDTTYRAINYLVNDFWPNYKITTWHGVIIDAWQKYGPPPGPLNVWTAYNSGGALNGSNGGILEPDIPLTQIGSNYGTLYDLMENICKITGYSWSIEYDPIAKDNFLKFWDPGQPVSSITLQTDDNIIGYPTINDDVPDVANVIIVPTTNIKKDMEEIKNVVSGQNLYILQYKPIYRNFQQSDGTTVNIDDPPQVYLMDSNSIYQPLVTVADGATVNTGDPTPQAYYNMENKWIKLVTTPTANKTGGLKMVYTTSIDGTMTVKNFDSINYYGEKQYVLTTKYSREDGMVAANNYLAQHAFSIQPVLFETNEFTLNVGDYVRVVLPYQGVDQVMPIEERNFISNGQHNTINLTLNKASLQDTDVIIDLFRRITDLEKTNSVGNVSSVVKAINVDDYASIYDTISYVLQ